MKHSARMAIRLKPRVIASAIAGEWGLGAGDWGEASEPPVPSPRDPIHKQPRGTGAESRMCQQVHAEQRALPKVAPLRLSKQERRIDCRQNREYHSGP